MNDQPQWLNVFNDASTSSFVDVLRRDHPHLLPEARLRPEDVVTVPHGTTVLSVSYRDGVIMAGDRQATAGYQVASRRIEKIYKADDYSGVGIAGAAGPAVEMAKLFQTELEHYEKVEGDNLSLEGKANKLGQMIRMIRHEGDDRSPLQVRHHRRQVRGDELRGARLGVEGCPGLAEEALAQGHDA